VILGQRLADGANDYRFAVLVYRKLGSADTFSSAKVTFNADGTVNDGVSETYVELGSGASQRKAKPISYFITRMSLKP
jgi:hypothetical protein